MRDEKSRNDSNEVPHGERTYEDVDAVMDEVTLWWNFLNSRYHELLSLIRENVSPSLDNFSDVEHAGQDEALELYPSQSPSPPARLKHSKMPQAQPELKKVGLLIAELPVPCLC